jgi:hypothetical protein
MGTINKHNYETYFLDYHEGALSREEMTAVVLFIETNEEFMEEFYNFKNVSLAPAGSEVIEADKIGLYQGPVVANREDYFVGLVEGDLTAEEELQVSELIEQHPIFQKELAAFETAKLAPIFVAYPGKKALKKSGVLIPLFKFAIPAAAASIIVLFLLNFGGLDRQYDRHTSGLSDELTDLSKYYANLSPVLYVAPNYPTNSNIKHAGQPTEDGKKPNYGGIQKMAIKEVNQLTVSTSGNLQSDFIKPDGPNEFQAANPYPVDQSINLLAKATQLADQKINGESKQNAASTPIKFIEKSIANVTKKKTEIIKTETRERKKFSLKIGGFGFSRSKGKKKS